MRAPQSKTNKHRQSTGGSRPLLLPSITEVALLPSRCRPLPAQWMVPGAPHRPRRRPSCLLLLQGRRLRVAQRRSVLLRAACTSGGLRLPRCGVLRGARRGGKNQRPHDPQGPPGPPPLWNPGARSPPYRPGLGHPLWPLHPPNRCDPAWISPAASCLVAQSSLGARPAPLLHCRGEGVGPPRLPRPPLSSSCESPLGFL